MQPSPSLLQQALREEGVCVCGGCRAEPNSAPGLRRVRQVSFPLPVSCYDVFFFLSCFSFFFFLSRPFLCALEQVKEVFKRRCHLGQQVEQSTEGAVLWNMSPGKLVCLYWLVRPASHLANTISPCDTGTGVNAAGKDLWKVVRVWKSVITPSESIYTDRSCLL